MSRWLFAGLCGLLAASSGLATAAADCNPLNLPAPHDPGKPGTVVLHGGGPLSDAIFEKFIALAGGKQAKIVLIPSGTYVRGRKDGIDFNETEEAFQARIARRFGSWLDLRAEGRIAAFRFLATDNQQDADDADFVAPLRQATGVWIPAAYQGKLDWRFAPDYPKKTSLFQTALREVVARGGVVGGLGGGMAALPEIMIMGDSGQGEGPAEAVVRHGLALFNGAIVDQLFDARGGRLERFTGLLKDTQALNRRLSWPAAGRSMIGLAVEPQTALLLQGCTVTAIGRQRAHIFTKSNGDRTITWRILTAADGQVSLASSSELFERPPAAGDRPAATGRKCKNPFGIPEPLSGGRPGTVVVHGGGGNTDLIPIYPGFCGVARPRLVHCPAASRDWQPQPGIQPAVLSARMEAYFKDWTNLVREGRLAGVRFLTAADPVHADDPDFVRPLLTADAVWFSGGDQGELARLFVRRQTPTRFQTEVFNVVRRGGVAGGTSAGAAVMSQIMIVADVHRAGQPFDARIGRGLGLLQNVLAEQHFQGAGRGGRIERFTRVLLDNDRLRQLAGADGPEPEGMIGVAVEERTALIFQENRVRVFGQQQGHIFLKSTDQKTITWHALQPGDAAFLVNGPDGLVLELDEWRIH
jgi:cyanophycinase